MLLTCTLETSISLRIVWIMVYTHIYIPVMDVLNIRMLCVCFPISAAAFDHLIDLPKNPFTYNRWKCQLKKGTIGIIILPKSMYNQKFFFFQFAVQTWCHLSPCLNDHSYSWVVNLLQLVYLTMLDQNKNVANECLNPSSLWLFVSIVLNCFKQSPTKTKLAMGRAANQSLRIERDIMLRHPGEKINFTYFLKG